MSNRKYLKRTEARIGDVIDQFLWKRSRTGKYGFHLSTLTNYVQKKMGRVAPDSPGRILREFRAKGKTDYIVDRSSSFYYLLWVE